MSYMQKSPIKKFRINRKTWLRGTLNSCLLNEDGKKCCLGFYSLARGLNKRDIVNKFEPSELTKDDNSFMLPELCCDAGDSKIASRLMCINDNSNTTDKVKEKAIKNNFKKLGVEVEFYN